MELRETQLGAEDCERVLVCFFVAVVFEVFPRTKQVDKIVQSTVLEMEDLLSVCVVIQSNKLSSVVCETVRKLSHTLTDTNLK